MSARVDVRVDVRGQGTVAGHAAGRPRTCGTGRLQHPGLIAWQRAFALPPGLPVALSHAGPSGRVQAWLRPIQLGAGRSTTPAGCGEPLLVTLWLATG